MAVTTGGSATGQPTTRRTVAIVVTDPTGAPAAGVRVEVLIDGMPSGHFDTGSGTAQPMTVTAPADATVELTLSAVGQVQRVRVAPGQNRVHLSVASTLRFAIQVPPVAKCPDQTTGRPCVTCRDPSGAEWELCV
jgi:hypothetical protein